MAALWDALELYLWNVLHRPGLADIADILVVAAIVYKLLMLTRDTRGSAVLKGLVLLLVVTWISDLLGLTALNWLLMSIIQNGALVLVILFHLDVAGVAIATAASQVISAVMVLWILFSPKGEFRLRMKELKIHTSHLSSIVRVGIPSGLGSMVFSIANVILQSSVNSFGNPAIIAGKTAAIGILTFLLYKRLSGVLKKLAVK